MKIISAQLGICPYCQDERFTRTLSGASKHTFTNKKGLTVDFKELTIECMSCRGSWNSADTLDQNLSNIREALKKALEK